TSNHTMVRRLGRNWKRLHRLAYIIPLLGVIHYWWLVKADVLEPLVYGVVLAGLLGFRFISNTRQRKNSANIKTFPLEASD
ncbi:Protein-methionine-sulfoxide reductase heme-binding subunit MsrQ, partial [hydrothermal vent metagenome]